MASILARIWCLSGVLFIKKTITVVLILLLSLSIIFSAPAGLFLFNAKAQSINNNLPRLSLPPISVTGKTIPSIPSSPIQTASNGINVPSNNPTIHTNFNIQTPIRSAGSTTTTPIIPTRISPVLNPNQQLQQQQQGRAAPIPNAGKSQSVYEGTTVMLDGSKSYDPNLGDSIVNYRWAQTSGIPVILVGGGSNSPNPTFVAPRLPTAGSTTTTTNMLTFSLTVTDNLGLTSTIPSITNVIVAYNPQIHATLNPTPQPTIIQNPSTSQQQLLPQNALPQLQRQLQLQPPLGNRVIVPSHIQNQSIPNIGNQYSNNINPYSFRPYYYQNKSLAANLSPQLRHNTLPFLNLSQHPTTKTSVGQNSSLPKIQAALNNSTHVPAGHINNTSVQPTNNSISLARPKALTATVGPQANNTNRNTTSVSNNSSSTVPNATSANLSSSTQGLASSTSTGGGTLTGEGHGVETIYSVAYNTATQTTDIGKFVDTTDCSYSGDLKYFQTNGLDLPFPAPYGTTWATCDETQHSEDLTLGIVYPTSDSGPIEFAAAENQVYAGLPPGRWVVGTISMNNDGTANIGIGLTAPDTFEGYGLPTTVPIQQSGGTITGSGTSSGSNPVFAPGEDSAPPGYESTIDFHNSASFQVTPPNSNPPPPPPPNQPPVAVATADKTEVNSGDTVNLDGSKSYDPDNNTPLKYSWSEPTSNFSSTDEKPTFTAPTVDSDTTYTISLQVTDSLGAVSQTPATVNVLVHPLPPCPITTISTTTPSSATKTNTITAAPLSNTTTKSPTASNSLAAPSSSNNGICRPPKISVQVANPEINPYPQMSTPNPPSTTIAVTGQKADGTPLSGAQVRVDVCTDATSSMSDGHLHDVVITICQDDRPKANLAWPASTTTGPILQGNPLDVTLDSNGQADIKYTTPSITDSAGKHYYISGIYRVIAALSSDASIKDDTKTITSKVPDLEQMPGSTTADNPCPSAAGDGYVFRQTNNHGCLYYGTPFTNNKMQKIAHQYVERQTYCANAFVPSTASACDTTPAGSNQKGYVIMPKTSRPDAMEIMAMSLPWGGFHDMGPEPNIGINLDNAKSWNLPFAGLEDGYDGVIDIRDLVLTGDNARLQILRDTILDNHGQLPYATEGGDMTQAPTDFHAHFVPNEKTDFTISCPDGPRGYPGKIYDAVCTIESFGGFSDVIDLTCAPTTDNTRHSQPLTCNFDPASVPATKDFFTTANLKVNIPAQKPSAQYILTVTATAHNQKIQHTTTVTLTCGLCLPPTERIPFEPLHVSDKGYQFTKDKEAFNLAPRAHITKDCSATVTKNCHVTHDRYGLYQDNGDKTHPTGFCTRGIGINAPYGKRACNQKDIDNYNKQYPGGETRQQAEAEQHKYEDGYAAQVNQLLEVRLTQFEYDAVVDYAYNHGAGNFETYLMPDINNAHCDDTLTISADFRHPGPAGGDRVAEQLNMFINGVYPRPLPANEQ